MFSKRNFKIQHIFFLFLNLIWFHYDNLFEIRLNGLMYRRISFRYCDFRILWFGISKSNRVTPCINSSVLKLVQFYCNCRSRITINTGQQNDTHSNRLAYRRTAFRYWDVHWEFIATVVQELSSTQTNKITPTQQAAI